MNVAQLIEELEKLPRHWPVHVETKDELHGTTDYHFTLDVQRHNFPSQGNMAVIRLGLEGVPQ